MPVLQEDQVPIYIRGLVPELRDKVLCSRAETLVAVMEAAVKLFSRMTEMKMVSPSTLMGAQNRPTSQPERSPQPDQNMAKQLRDLKRELSLLRPRMQPIQECPEPPRTKDNAGRPKCAKCNKIGHLSDVCGIKCHNCGRLGHRKIHCRATVSTAAPSKPTTPTLKVASIQCTHCSRMGHLAENCYNNPASPCYRPPQSR